MKNKINNLIIEIGENMLSIIHDKGYVLAGNNGPYFCQDTPVRNSVHWICIYRYLFRLTHNEKYYKALLKLADYLVSFNSNSGAIECMLDNKMDHLNGSIGQAWAIEGLICAYELVGDNKYYDKAVRIFLSQEYDTHRHLWSRIELDGKDIGFDKVFNHQLWFAASGFLIENAKHCTKIAFEIDDFMKNIDCYFDVYKDGLIKHYLVGFENSTSYNFKSFLKKMFRFFAFLDPRFDSLYFEKGYHLFNLYSFALIYNCNPKYTIFESTKMKKALSYGLNIKKLNKSFNIDKFLNTKNNCLIKYNKYSYSYNSPAFEFPLIDYVFNNGKNPDVYEILLDKQLKMTYNSDLKMFSRNNSDAATLTARIYELTRYLELVIDHEKK